MYYLVYGFLYLVSLLPMWILYPLGDITGYLLFQVFGYRQEIVKKNLLLAFPEKTKEELRKLNRSFQRNFTDTFIETLKLFSAGKEFITTRMKGDFDVFNDLLDRGLRCQVHMGHNFNWELANLAYGHYCNQPMLGVYMPLKNKGIDRVFRKLRSKSGTILLPATNMKASMLPYRDKQYLLGLVADQVPSKVAKAYWLNFFGHPAAFTPGPEKGARAGNIPVAFVHITKISRGHYYLHVKIATENPAGLTEGQLTLQYRDFLETTIRESPDMWLWSHRRWKRSWEPAYADRWIDRSPAPQETVSPYKSVTV